MNTTRKPFAAAVATPFLPIRVPVGIMLVYFWWILWTPAVRFPILSDIFLEKIIAALWLLSIVFQPNKPRLWSPFTSLILFQFVLLTVLSNLTWVEPDITSEQWKETYWKKMYFFVMAVLSIRDRNDFRHALFGVSLIVLFYQVLSWRDFLAGGSYVYQQGIKRMKGMWVVPGYGAGNFWGSLSAFTLPFAIYSFRYSKSSIWKYAMTLLLILLILSVFFSGSRGSLATMIALAGFYFRKSWWRPKYFLLIVAATVLAVSFLPPELKSRYSMIFVSQEDIHTGTREEQIAKTSAASRLQGLEDGWNLMRKHPQGSGPGTSHIARGEVNADFSDGSTLQLHNLYGQVMAETGVLGTFVILFLWIKTFTFLTRRPENDRLELEKEAIAGLLVCLLVYGMASHSLYDYWWIFVYAFTVSIFNIENASTNELSTDEKTSH